MKPTQYVGCADDVLFHAVSSRTSVEEHHTERAVDGEVRAETLRRAEDNRGSGCCAKVMDFKQSRVLLTAG